MYVPAPEKTRPFGAALEEPGRTFGVEGVLAAEHVIGGAKHAEAVREALVDARPVA